jgi:peptidoglycan hydrolase CwlO-like protein
MYKVLLGCVFACVLGVSSAGAQLSAVAPAAAQSGDKVSEQVNACREKVNDLSNQLPPLQKKRSGLWTERKSIGTSGGDSAKYKLTHLDQEIGAVTKQIDGVNRQIEVEQKRCTELTAKPAAAPKNAPLAQQPTPQPTKKKNNSNR